MFYSITLEFAGSWRKQIFFKRVGRNGRGISFGSLTQSHSFKKCQLNQTQYAYIYNVRRMKLFWIKYLKIYMHHEDMALRSQLALSLICSIHWNLFSRRDNFNLIKYHIFWVRIPDYSFIEINHCVLFDVPIYQLNPNNALDIIGIFFIRKDHQMSK